MCGIAGFSLSSNSKISPRKLSNALLSELDVRGNQASGFAFQTKDSQGLFKKAVAGAALSLKSMPRSTTTAILHTRYATHGTINVMANNHPVQSPDESISLVHNGVIYNHELVRTALDLKLPEVDSSVIPAILQSYDRDFNKLNMLDGDASVAWLDSSSMGVMQVARISHSPLTVAQLLDGTFVFASTEDILKRALKKAGLRYDYLSTVPERTLLTVRSGIISAVEALPETDPEFVDKTWYGSYDSFRGMTSGGHSNSGAWAEDYDDEQWSKNYCYTGKSNVEPRYVKYQSAWGDVLVPEAWMQDEEDTPPYIPGFFANEYGEYFEVQSGQYVGGYYDLLEMGYMDDKYMPEGDFEQSEVVDKV